MGSTQSQEEPDVVRINRSEVPDEYKTVGVSSDVVKRVNSQSQDHKSGDTSKLREELAREREEKLRMREEMARLSELQQRTVLLSTPLDLSADFEERKRIFEETVERVQSRFFAYHRENVCASNEKSSVFIVLVLQIFVLSRFLFFSSAFSPSHGFLLLLRYRNCSSSTCLRSHPCMLDYMSISIYIQPILKVVDEDGTVLTPIPSMEFYSIRSLLEGYSVPDPNEACIFFPGVDFLNLHRFPSIEAAHAIANMLSERFYNVFIFTLVGQWKHGFRHILASSVTPRRIYRPRLDISLPPFLDTPSSASPQGSLIKPKFVVPLFNVSLSFREECIRLFSDKEDVTVLIECFDQRSVVCNSNGNRVSWEDTFQRARFGLIHESMLHFEAALYRALEASVIPVIFAPNYVLPFADYVDWHLIALFPSNLSRVLDILNSLTPSKVESMRTQIEGVFTRFSSLPGIVNMTLHVLEWRLLPTKTHSVKRRIGLLEKPFILPHLERAAQLLLLVESDRSSISRTLQLIRKLASSGLLSSVTVIWRDMHFAPSSDDWESVLPVEIVTGVRQLRGLRSIVKQLKTDVLLVMPMDICSVDNKILKKAVNVWRTSPDRAIILPCFGSNSSAVIVHRVSF
ncbi:hypothetical protein Angca_004036, partial [Angiostrongylus cantonensis]